MDRRRQWDEGYGEGSSKREGAEGVLDLSRRLWNRDCEWAKAGRAAGAIRWVGGDETERPWQSGGT